MRQRIGALSAYVPARAADDFADPLKHYILETTAREERKIRVRQLGIVLVLIGGILVSQWPVAFSSATAVASVVERAEASTGHASAFLPERLAFAGNLQDSL